MGKILLDLWWNAVEEGYGWSEAAKPVYDQKLWKDEGFMEPPTIRSVADINAQIVGQVLFRHSDQMVVPTGCCDYYAIYSSVMCNYTLRDFSMSLLRDQQGSVPVVCLTLFRNKKVCYNKFSEVDEKK